MKLDQQTRMIQEQTLALTPQMLQSLSMLQMNGESLYAFLLEQAMENPLIEMDHLERAEKKRRSRKRGDGHGSQPEPQLMAPDRIADDLKLQFSMLGPAKAEARVGYFLIESLNARGYLPREALSEAALLCRDASVLRRARSLLHRLEPPGIGAVDLRECLLLQLRHKGLQDGDAWRIVSRHLPLLGRNRLPALARAAGMTLGRVIAAAKQIRNLEPYPLQGMGDEPVRYVVPDIRIFREEDAFAAKLNQIPPEALEISSAYQGMEPGGDEELRRYLTEQIGSVKWISRCLRRRWDVLAACAAELIRVQRGFFERGEAALVPYTRREMAAALGLHESTVSRAMKDKQIECDRGIFPTDFFFPQSFAEAESALRQEAAAAIRTILQAEDRNRPLSDQAIAMLLPDYGVRISRRTVAKYREQLGIPDSSLRRSYA